MPFLLEDLVIDRVDLVDEGANSAAFIELYKRKEQSTMNVTEILSKMKPEHSKVIQDAIDAAAEDLRKSKEDLTAVTKERDDALADLQKSKDDLAAVTQERDDAQAELAKAKETCECDGEEDEDGKCKSCGKPKKKAKAAAFDETETIKSMPAEARAMFEKMKNQKEAAEEELRKAKEAEADAAAIAKAKELKAIPVEQSVLVGIIKSASKDVLDILAVANAAIEGTVLSEVGKSHTGAGTTDAWSKIEKKADDYVTEHNVTKAKAISMVIKENPELYKEYLQGGAN